MLVGCNDLDSSPQKRNPFGKDSGVSTISNAGKSGEGERRPGARKGQQEMTRKKQSGRRIVSLHAAAETIIKRTMFIYDIH